MKIIWSPTSRTKTKEILKNLEPNKLDVIEYTV